METQILRNILEESTSAYIEFKGIKEDDIYVDIEIIDMNKSYLELNNKINAASSETLLKSILKNNNLDINTILELTSKNTIYKTSKNIKFLHYNYLLMFFSGPNEEYYCKIEPIQTDTVHLSETFRNSSSFVWIKDLEGRYIDMNTSYLKFLDKEYDEVIGKDDYSLWPKETADKITKQDREALEFNKLDIYNEYLYTNSHKKIYFQTSKWPYVNKENVVQGVIGIAVDVTDKVEKGDKLQQQDHEEVFTQLANNMEQTIYVRDEDKVLYLSPSFYKKNIFSPEPLFEDIRHWIKNWDKVEFEEHPSDYHDKNVTLDTYKITKNGIESWYTNKSIPVFDDEGNISKRICIITNITEAKNMQDELEQQRLNYFANLSHELRTPINIILSSLEVIKLRLNRLNQGDQEYFDRYLSIINQNGLRLLKLVNNLIDTTKIDSGNFTFEPRNYDIISFVENICLSVSEFVKQKNMEIVFDTNVEENLLSFDLDNMERIILNLLSNAIKFNSEEGIIEVTIQCNDEVKISVKDQGIGIPKEKLDNIFDRFEQVDDKLKRSKEGSGIGLSLVKALVGFHHGSITVNSEVGKGSEFIVTLPNVIRTDIKHEEKINTYNNVNMMRVEFSDIYS